MLSPDMMGQGGPPPGMDQGQGPPPELLAQLMGGMGASGGMPPQGMGEEQEPQGEMTTVEHLRIAIEHAQAALVAEPDDADSQALAKVVQGLYAIFAQRQKEQEQLLGGGNIRALSRTQG